MKTIETPQDAVDVLRDGMVQQDGVKDMPEMDVCFMATFGLVRYGQRPDATYYRIKPNFIGDSLVLHFDTLEELAERLYADRSFYNAHVLRAAQQARAERHYA